MGKHDMTYLPSFCPEHSNEPVQIKIESYPEKPRARCFCAVCGLELCSEKEFNKRCKHTTNLFKEYTKNEHDND